MRAGTWSGRPRASECRILATHMPHDALSEAHPGFRVRKGPGLAKHVAGRGLYPNRSRPSLPKALEASGSWPYAPWDAGMTTDQAGIGLRGGRSVAKRS